MAVTKWEHSSTRAMTEAELMVHAKARGEDGWQLVSVLVDPAPGIGQGTWVAFFKREVTPAE